jgi:hypothetical protein
VPRLAYRRPCGQAAAAATPSRPRAFPPPVSLAGRHVRIEALSLEHVDALASVAAAAPDAFALTFVPPSRDGMRTYVETALAAASSSSRRTIPRV